jgi:hypothetical protein
VEHTSRLHVGLVKLVVVNLVCGHNLDVRLAMAVVSTVDRQTYVVRLGSKPNALAVEIRVGRSVPADKITSK